MIFFKTLNTKLFTITLSLLMICQVGISQRGSTTELTIVKGDNSGGVLNPTPTSGSTSTSTGSIDVEVSDVILEAVHPVTEDVTIPEYKVWIDFAVDFGNINLEDVEKFSFYISNSTGQENYAINITEGLDICDDKISSIDVTPNAYYTDVMLYDLVEIYFTDNDDELHPDCYLKSTAAVGIIIDSSDTVIVGLSRISKDCYDFHYIYETYIDIIDAEVLMRSTQNAISIAGDTFEEDFYVPTCFQDSLTSESNFDINLMLNSWTSTSIDVDVYVRTAKPDATLWIGNSIDISFNNADLLNPVLTPAENVGVTLNTNGNIASLAFAITESLPAQEQIFIGKLRFDYTISPLSNPAPTGFSIISDFIVESTTNVFCVNSDGTQSSLTINSYDTEDIEYHWTDGGETVPEGEEESGFGKLSSFEADNNIHLSPNPASKHINISVADEIVFAEVAIFNIGGKMVYREQIYKNYATMDVSNFENGLYIVSVTTKSKHYKSKLLVQTN